MTGQEHQQTPPPLPNWHNQNQQQPGWGQTPPPGPDQQQYRQPPPPRYIPPPPRSGTAGIFLHSCLVSGCAIAAAPVVLLGLLALVVIFVANSGLADPSSTLDSTSSVFSEKVLRRGGADKGTIAIISVQGEIDGIGSPLEGTGMLGSVSEQLRAAREDDEVEAVIIQMDSPGGSLSASDIIHNEIMELKTSGKPVVVWAGGLMASGGYYIAAGADSIIASPTAMIGSIGVILQRFQIDGLMKMLGLKSDPIMAGKSKDLGSPFRDMTPEERALLQKTVDQAHRRFIGIVASGRGLSEEETAKLADGAIFTAEDSLDHGLIDKIGYFDTAIATAEELAGEQDMRIISYRRIFNLSDLFSRSGRNVLSLLGKLAASGETHPRLAAEWTGPDAGSGR